MSQTSSPARKKSNLLHDEIMGDEHSIIFVGEYKKKLKDRARFEEYAKKLDSLHQFFIKEARKVSEGYIGNINIKTIIQIKGD